MCFNKPLRWLWCWKLLDHWIIEIPKNAIFMDWYHVSMSWIMISTHPTLQLYFINPIAHFLSPSKTTNLTTFKICIIISHVIYFPYTVPSLKDFLITPVFQPPVTITLLQSSFFLQSPVWKSTLLFKRFPISYQKIGYFPLLSLQNNFISSLWCLHHNLICNIF